MWDKYFFLYWWKGYKAIIKGNLNKSSVPNNWTWQNRKLSVVLFQQGISFIGAPLLTHDRIADGVIILRGTFQTPVSIIKRQKIVGVSNG
jgi:hypothetical protein